MQRARHHRLVVGAVGMPYHRYADNNLPLLGLDEHVDFSVVEEEAGSASPFAMAAQRGAVAWRLLHGAAPAPGSLAPSEMLHIGSSLTHDFLAARRAGVRALLLDPSERATHEQLPRSDMVRCLSDVPRKLDEIMLA